MLVVTPSSLTFERRRTILRSAENTRWDLVRLVFICKSNARDDLKRGALTLGKMLRTIFNVCQDVSIFSSYRSEIIMLFTAMCCRCWGNETI
jgi:hypothetical protein